MNMTILLFAAAMLASFGSATADIGMPPVPPPEKQVKDYTAENIVGCLFGVNKEQPQEHPLRVKDAVAKLKAEWPGAKVASNVDTIIGYILLADSPARDQGVGDGVYWIIKNVMDVPNSDKAAAYARIYAAQTTPENKRKVAFLARFLFPYLVDERVLAPLIDMLDDDSVYQVRIWGEERKEKVYTTVRSIANGEICRFLRDHDLLSVGLPENQYFLSDADLQHTELGSGRRTLEDDAKESAGCGFLKTWLTNHWQQVVAKCVEARAKPNRAYQGPALHRILTPIGPDRHRHP